MKTNINMKKILFFLLIQCLAWTAYAQDAAIKEAETAYTKEDYGKAIELYEGILKSSRRFSGDILQSGECLL